MAEKKGVEMTASDAQRRATSAYRKRSVRQVVMRFYPTGDDPEIYEWIKSKDNATAYLKELVRRDMAESGE